MVLLAALTGTVWVYPLDVDRQSTVDDPLIVNVGLTHDSHTHFATIDRRGSC